MAVRGGPYQEYACRSRVLMFPPFWNPSALSLYQNYNSELDAIRVEYPVGISLGCRCRKGQVHVTWHSHGLDPVLGCCQEHI